MRCVSKIADLREAAGITQRELALQVGVTETTIANWERGRSGLDWIDRLIKLCKTLNCSLEDLVAYEDAMETEAEPSFEELRQMYRAGRLGTKVK
jgi:transcriptional regulator with XRE-family HTH domain